MTLRAALTAPIAASLAGRLRLGAFSGLTLLTLGAASLAPVPAVAATIECRAATTFSGFRPPSRFGNDEVAIAPWDGGMLFWSRDARFRFEQAPGVTITYRNGDTCRVPLTAETLTAAGLPVLPGEAEKIEVMLCPVEASASAPPCSPNTLQFLPR